MEDIGREEKYLNLLAEVKCLQKECGSKAKRAQAKLVKVAKKYGRELADVIIKEEHIMRKYTIAGKYILEFITQTGQITVYSYPGNAAILPRIEVHHAIHGFIAFWNDEELNDSPVWKLLSAKYYPIL